MSAELRAPQPELRYVSTHATYLSVSTKCAGDYSRSALSRAISSTNVFEALSLVNHAVSTRHDGTPPFLDHEPRTDDSPAAFFDDER